MARKSTHTLPSALERIAEIMQRADGKNPIGAFLDYDGTLTPIVNRPEDAFLSEHMRDVVKSLAHKCTVAVISGRGLNDVRERVGIPDIYYAGSHGFELSGPGGRRRERREASAFLPVLEEAEGELHRAFDALPGIQIERKRYSVAVHFRRAARREREEVQKGVQIIQRKHKTKLRVSPGKCVYDFQPRIEWHKGKALSWILDAAFAKPGNVFPLYIGDDITDEDAFREIKDRGVGIVVREARRLTEADYALESPEEVGRFLESFARLLPAKTS